MTSQNVKHEVWLRRATYADGSLVQVGDQIRYHQAPGGLMAPSRDADGDTIWHYGTAVKIPWYQDDAERRATAHSHGIDVDEIVLQCEDSRLCNLFGHVIERIES